MKLFLSILLFLSLISTTYAYPVKPDIELTPGDYCTKDDPDFTSYRYRERIPYCRRHVTEMQKNEIYDDYNIPLEDRHNYTIDHLIPLSLGGSNSYLNLWTEHKAVKRLRYNLELRMYYKILKGEITRDHAVKIILDHKRMNIPYLDVTQD
jgi:hypothetical protein